MLVKLLINLKEQMVRTGANRAGTDGRGEPRHPPGMSSGMTRIAGGTGIVTGSESTQIEFGSGHCKTLHMPAISNSGMKRHAFVAHHLTDSIIRPISFLKAAGPDSGRRARGWFSFGELGDSGFYRKSKSSFKAAGYRCTFAMRCAADELPSVGSAAGMQKLACVQTSF
jgi:hypothetical protein